MRLSLSKDNLRIKSNFVCTNDYYAQHGLNLISFILLNCGLTDFELGLIAVGAIDT